ncbi:MULTISPECIES: hypothetical protein [unclassified Rathayibacter]|uniref:hypothetical protein n=1 Tax=unclassified Rathayibacter TaxID=2609250 RepID=UPI0006F571A3|nr:MULTISPECIES: hypothetical protein [unclassified Rathayibacter]KQQ06114.1 hypothetical protein ASF42_06240 [Rathayibacter sp. Leaf294]KQS13971.1 hypothetical protein ASG06_06250 [Rathayibacter sp. Leaf185]
MNRLLRWMFVRSRVDERDHGACAWCSSPLQLCPACLGGWRGRRCDCGTGLVCAQHAKRWM